MLSMGIQRQVWVFMQPTDMRKQFDSLYGLVKGFHTAPLSGDLFLFVSKDRKKAKALFWDGTGLVIYSKRIERGKFADIFSRGRMTMSEVSLFFEGSSSVKNRLSPRDETHRYT
jgi:transposase